MSWSTAISRAKAVIDKRSDARPAEADHGVPMGARIGGVISFKVSPFLRAMDSLVSQPDPVAQIVSISRLRVPMQGAVHRLYTARGDGGAGQECFLQVYTDAAGDVQEIVYFQRMLRMIPATPEEQAAFLGEGGAGLGQNTFNIYKAQLEQIGFQLDRLPAAFGEADSIEYARRAGDASQEFIAPYRGVENRIDDSQGHNGLRQDVVFMPYGRICSGGVEEQLLICTEILKEQNGDMNRREIHVDFMVGLVLAKEGVTVQ